MTWTWNPFLWVTDPSLIARNWPVPLGSPLDAGENCKLKTETSCLFLVNQTTLVEQNTSSKVKADATKMFSLLYILIMQVQLDMNNKHPAVQSLISESSEQMDWPHYMRLQMSENAVWQECERVQTGAHRAGGTFGKSRSVTDVPGHLWSTHMTRFIFLQQKYTNITFLYHWNPTAVGARLSGGLVILGEELLTPSSVLKAEGR